MAADMATGIDTRIHVVHMVLSLEPGGLENGVVNVVHGLAPVRFRSTVVCLKARGAFAAGEAAAAAGRVITALSVISFPAKSSPFICDPAWLIDAIADGLRL